jgi:hypothetical protein
MKEYRLGELIGGGAVKETKKEEKAVSWDGLSHNSVVGINLLEDSDLKISFGSNSVVVRFKGHVYKFESKILFRTKAIAEEVMKDKSKYKSLKIVERVSNRSGHKYLIWEAEKL